MNSDPKLYQIFYTKDLNKKKKVYSDGFLICLQKKTKMFNEEGQCILTVNNKSPPEIDVEYILNHSYLILAERELPFDDYVSGKIFIEKVATNLVVIPVKNKLKKASLHKIQYSFQKEFPNGLKIESFIYQLLRPHQVQGVSFMYECITGQKGKNIEGCILADFMGLGKTLQTLTLIRCILIQKIVQKIIVICPLTLVKVWQKQCQKWMANKLSPLVALGNADQISKKIRMFIDCDYRFMIVSYENYYKNSDNFNKKCDLMIFDEGHRLKNKNSKLLKKIKMTKCKKRVLLTGTPLQNNLGELYTCISLVNPIFFQSQSLFRNVFQKPIIAGMAKNASHEERQLALSRTGELALRIKEFSLRRKADVLEQYLPKKKEFQIFFKLSPIQATIYEKLMKKKASQTDALSMINMLRKLFTHPILFKNDRFQNEQLKDYLDDCRDEKSCKIEFIKEVALKCKNDHEKLIIVSYFTETLDFIEEMLKKNEISTCKLDGRLDAQERFRVLESFINKNDVLLLSGKAGGTGLTLICACKMIMIEPDWNPSNDSQVMGRIWRQGQTKEVQIYRLFIACSIQEKILQRQQLKESLSQKLIDNKVNNTSYDFLSMKQLFIEMTEKCITYSQSKNRATQFIKNHASLDSESIIFVNVKESHQKENLTIKNEFQQAEFMQESEGQKQEDEGIQDEMDKINEQLLYLQSKCENINKPPKESQRQHKIIKERREQDEKSQDQTNSVEDRPDNANFIGKNDEKKEQIGVNNSQENIQKGNTQENPEKTKKNDKLPAILRKMKRKLIDLPPASNQ